MKKRLLTIISASYAASSFAQTGAEGFSYATDGVVSYLPVVQTLCYAIAGVIAVVGALSVYIAYQTHPETVRKRMMLTVGGALCFVCMSTALPQFFGLDGSEIAASISGSGSSTTTSSDSYLATDEGGIPQSSIITEIPSLSSGLWVSATDLEVLTGLKYSSY